MCVCVEHISALPLSQEQRTFAFPVRLCEILPLKRSLVFYAHLTPTSHTFSLHLTRKHMWMHMYSPSHPITCHQHRYCVFVCVCVRAGTHLED